MDLTAITLTELRYLVAVADTGHFGRAATDCHVSQPTLSTQIKKLEGTLGVALLERGSRRVQVTPAGRRIVERARLILEELRAIGDLAQGQRRPLAGPFRLGIIPTLGPYLLPWLLAPLQTAFPELRLVLQESVTSTLLDDLALHRLDAALLALPITAPGLDFEPLFDEPFWMMVPAVNPLASRESICLSELNTERVLLLTEGHCLRDQALEICGSGRSAEDNAFRATSLETLRHMVAAGLGCTLMPALALAAAGKTEAVVARRFTEPAPHRRIALVWRRSLPGIDAVQALAAFIRSHLPDAVAPVTEPAGRK